MTSEVIARRVSGREVKGRSMPTSMQAIAPPRRLMLLQSDGDAGIEPGSQRSPDLSNFKPICGKVETFQPPASQFKLLYLRSLAVIAPLQHLCAP
eukprot:489738-Rhodomonas_salina.1